MHILNLLARLHPEHAQLIAPLPEPAHPVAAVVARNITAVRALRQATLLARTRHVRAADRITAFSGSMPFLYLHAAWFGAWMLLNVGEHPILAFDPFPFGLLTMIVSLEAIFLSTFVLISQNKQSAAADRRADLDLQINLLAEYEITRMLRLVDAMAQKMGVAEASDPALDDLKATTRPDEVMRTLEEESGSGG
jgi:uncharacterized membrane protein